MLSFPCATSQPPQAYVIRLGVAFISPDPAWPVFYSRCFYLPFFAGRSTELLVSDRGVGNRYLLLDHLGSPEVILEQLSFDPWVNRRQQDGSPAEETIASSTPTGFTGHEMDEDTGLIKEILGTPYSILPTNK